MPPTTPGLPPPLGGLKQPLCLVLLLMSFFMGVSVSTEETADPLGVRSPRLFSMFNIVTFKNEACVGTDSSEEGICLSASDCGADNGRSLGNCAMGFGVCCRITVTECGASVKRNCSFIQNPEFPSGTERTGSCSFTIEKERADICFIRLDFKRLELGHVDGNGNCISDKVKMTQGNGFPLGELCDTLTGQHMYLDAGPDVDPMPITINHEFNDASAHPVFQYKVTQIECGTPTTPDKGCEMFYFGGPTGIIESYNFQGNYHLNHQHYTVCVRQEKGYCKIEYTPTDEPFSFKMSRPATNQQSLAAFDCQTDYIIIPRGRPKTATPGTTVCSSMQGGNPVSFYESERYCGGTLSCTRASTVTMTIVSEAGPPFHIFINTNHDEQNVPNTNRGFQLKYVQTPC